MPPLHAQVAALLGWTLAEAQSFSLPTLREMVRGAPPSDDRNWLLADISAAIQSGSYLTRPTFEVCRHDYPAHLCFLCP